MDRRTAVSAAYLSHVSRYSGDHILALRESHFVVRAALCPGHFVRARSELRRTNVYGVINSDIRLILSPAHALTDNSTSTAVLSVNLLAFITRLSWVLLMAGTSQLSLPALTLPALTMRCGGAHFVTDNFHTWPCRQQLCHKFHPRESDCIEPYQAITED